MNLTHLTSADYELARRRTRPVWQTARLHALTALCAGEPLSLKGTL